MLIEPQRLLLQACEQILESWHSLRKWRGLVPLEKQLRQDMTAAFEKVRREFFKGLSKDDLREGDLPGHEFHGNQWTAGTSGSGAEEGVSKERYITAKHFDDDPEDDVTKFIDDVGARVSDQCAESDDEAAGFASAAIDEYTDGAYEPANFLLRTGHGPGETEEEIAAYEDTKGIIRGMDAAFKVGAQALEQDTVVYRAMPKSIGGRYRGFTDKGFVSVTLLSGYAADFSGYTGENAITAIFLPKGTKVLAGNRDEWELILDRGQRFESMEEKIGGLNAFRVKK